MANFAVLDGENIINTIIADSKETAEEITGKTCIFFNESDRAETGGKYIDSVFIPKKPYNSWILNTENNEWMPPTEYPGTTLEDPTIYKWDEDTVSWVAVE